MDTVILIGGGGVLLWLIWQFWRGVFEIRPHIRGKDTWWQFYQRDAGRNLTGVPEKMGD